MYPCLILGIVWHTALAQVTSTATVDYLAGYECFASTAICVAQNDMNERCEALEIPNSPDYYECLCGSGFIPVVQACDDCERAHNKSVDTWYYSYMSEKCVSGSFSIAPLPETAETLYGAHNATTTGSISEETEVLEQSTSLPPKANTFSIWTPEETFAVTQDGMPSNIPTAEPSVLVPTDGPFAGGGSTDAATRLEACMSYWVAGVAIAGAALADAFF